MADIEGLSDDVSDYPEIVRAFCEASEDGEFLERAKVNYEWFYYIVEAICSQYQPVNITFDIARIARPHKFLNYMRKCHVIK